MKYAIIENERLALDLIKAIVKNVRPEWELAFTAGTVADAVEHFKNEGEADLCFMDIELNDGNCFDIFDEVRLGIPVIFTTAYDEFLLKAFKVYSVDYLLKPVLETDIERAILKFERYFNSRKDSAPAGSDQVEKIAKLKRYRSAPKRVLTVTGDRYGFLDTDRIAWLVSEDKYVYAVDLDGNRRMTTFETLGEANELLEGDSFFFLRRNLICAPAAIESVSKYFKGRLKVILRAGERSVEAVVSADKRQAFLNWLGGL